MSASLLFTLASGGPPELITVDVVTEQTQSFSNSITDYEVELGSNISDHIRAMPFLIKFTGLVVDFAFNQQPKNAQQVRDRIIQLRAQNALITFSHLGKAHDNLAIESLDFPEEINLGGGVKFSCSLKEIRQVQSATTQIFQRAQTRNGHNVVKKGEQAGKEPTEKEKRTTRSLAESIFSIYSPTARAEAKP